MTGLHFQETYIGMKTTVEIKVNVNVNIISHVSLLRPKEQKSMFLNISGDSQHKPKVIKQ